jgi:hypothetical protein
MPDRAQRRSETWGRVIALLPWALGQGLLTSVVVACACVVVRGSSSFDVTGRETADPGGWLGGYYSLASRFGATYLHVTDNSVSTLADESGDGDPGLFARASLLDRMCGGELARSRDLLRDPRVQGTDGSGRITFSVYSAGLPMRCLHGADFHDAWPEPVTIGLWKLDDLGERVLCYRPLWLGLAADTVFWGALWLGALAIPGAVSRRRRRARGLCPACGYDLRGDFAPGCPECAWNRTPAPHPHEPQSPARAHEMLKARR